MAKARDNQLGTLTCELACWIMKTPRYGSQLGLNVYMDKKLKRFNALGLIEEEPKPLSDAAPLDSRAMPEQARAFRSCFDARRGRGAVKDKGRSIRGLERIRYQPPPVSTCL